MVVGYENSGRGRSALALAADEASTRRAPLSVIVAEDIPVWSNPLAMPPYPPSALGSHDRAALAHHDAAELRREHPGVPIAVYGTSGPLTRALAHQSPRAAVVVVGRDPNPGGPAGLLVDSASLRLALRAKCPVLVAGDRAGNSGRPVVLADTGAGTPGEEMSFAFEQASTRGVALVVCRLDGGACRCGAARERTDGRFARALQQAADRHPAVDMRQHSSPEGADVGGDHRALAEAGLLVVHAPSRRFSSGWSLLKQLLRQLPCPVAAVPAVSASG